jgi:hypothetical protein
MSRIINEEKNYKNEENEPFLMTQSSFGKMNLREINSDLKDNLISPIKKRTTNVDSINADSFKLEGKPSKDTKAMFPAVEIKKSFNSKSKTKKQQKINFKDLSLNINVDDINSISNNKLSEELLKNANPYLKRNSKVAKSKDILQRISGLFRSPNNKTELVQVTNNTLESIRDTNGLTKEVPSEKKVVVFKSKGRSPIVNLKDSIRDDKDNEMHFGHKALHNASVYNKTRKFEEILPKIQNSKIKQLIYEIKDHTSFGPYLSNCSHCNLKNIEFYNSANPDIAIQILSTIKKNIDSGYKNSRFDKINEINEFKKLG